MKNHVKLSKYIKLLLYDVKVIYIYNNYYANRPSIVTRVHIPPMCIIKLFMYNI